MELLETLVKLLVQEQGIAHLPPAWEHLNGLAKKEKFLWSVRNSIMRLTMEVKFSIKSHLKL